MLYPPRSVAADETSLVDELAQLARVQLAPEDARALGAQLDTILAYIRGLRAVEVEGVPEYAGAALRTGLRDDTPCVQADPDRVLSAAKPNHDHLVEVPKFKD